MKCLKIFWTKDEFVSKWCKLQFCILFCQFPNLQHFFSIICRLRLLEECLACAEWHGLGAQKDPKTQKATKGNRGGFSCLCSQASTSGVNLGIAVWLGAKDVVKNVSF